MSLPISFGNPATAAGLSGMRAAQLRLDSSAHNVANVQTPDMRRQVVTQTARPGLGGVEAGIGREAAGAAPGTHGFDRLAEDLVEQRLSLYSFEANLRTVQAHDRMLGTLLDISA